mmetsp:Transcript_9616/g.34190  ORF Transcript_9616/g.34190 Transcript_9616/m.34190 type:complete len:483 (+) Transcript_9616:2519-3967(+)
MKVLGLEHSGGLAQLLHQAPPLPRRALVAEVPVLLLRLGLDGLLVVALFVWQQRQVLQQALLEPLVTLLLPHVHRTQSLAADCLRVRLQELVGGDLPGGRGAPPLKFTRPVGQLPGPGRNGGWQRGDADPAVLQVLCHVAPFADLALAAGLLRKPVRLPSTFLLPALALNVHLLGRVVVLLGQRLVLPGRGVPVLRRPQVLEELLSQPGLILQDAHAIFHTRVAAATAHAAGGGAGGGRTGRAGAAAKALPAGKPYLGSARQPLLWRGRPRGRKLGPRPWRGRRRSRPRRRLHGVGVARGSSQGPSASLCCRRRRGRMKQGQEQVVVKRAVRAQGCHGLVVSLRQQPLGERRVLAEARCVGTQCLRISPRNGQTVCRGRSRPRRRGHRGVPRRRCRIVPRLAPQGGRALQRRRGRCGGGLRGTEGVDAAPILISQGVEDQSIVFTNRAFADVAFGQRHCRHAGARNPGGLRGGAHRSKRAQL